MADLPDGLDYAPVFIDLNTWERHLLPEMEDALLAGRIVWLEDAHKIGFSFTDAPHLIYDTTTRELSTGFGGEINQVRYDDLSIGQPIHITGTSEGDGVHLLTLDREGFPRFYDGESGRPPVQFRPEFVATISLSHNQAWFAVTRDVNDQRDLHLVPVWEGEAVNLTQDTLLETYVTWSTDDRYIAYHVFDGPARELRIVEVGTGEVVFTLDDNLMGDRISWVN